MVYICCIMLMLSFPCRFLFVCVEIKAKREMTMLERRCFMKSRVPADSWIINLPIAHRGLHGNGAGENTRTAYARAIEKGYPIEMDVQLTKDGELVCFHDDNVKRVTGVDKLIWDMTLEEVRALKVCGTQDGVMTFKEFLDFVDGRTPLLIEIKQQRDGKKSGIEKKVVELLDNYNGEFAVQSFDPFIMQRVRKLRPEFLRGQLGGAKPGMLAYPKYVVVRKLLLNFLSKPDFINYVIEEFPIKTKLPVMRWTINTEERKRTAYGMGHNIVFENIDPSK